MNGDVLAHLATKRLIFTVTSGRSGTGLLAALLRQSSGIVSDHEPAPRLNFMLRSVQAVPEAAAAWLLTEKLPALAERATGPIYAETSHLLCKGFVEPLLDLGVRPAFIMLARPASEVACSLFRMDVIPGRTSSGKLVLLDPTDRGVLSLPEWTTFSDYQLCYWYALEIERRQEHYAALFEARGLSFVRTTLAKLGCWDDFRALSLFVTGSSAPDRAGYDNVICENQNSRLKSTGGAVDRDLPEDLQTQEQALHAAIFG